MAPSDKHVPAGISRPDKEHTLALFTTIAIAMGIIAKRLTAVMIRMRVAATSRIHYHIGSITWHGSVRMMPTAPYQCMAEDKQHRQAVHHLAHEATPETVSNAIHYCDISCIHNPLTGGAAYATRTGLSAKWVPADRSIPDPRFGVTRETFGKPERTRLRCALLPVSRVASSNRITGLHLRRRHLRPRLRPELPRRRVRRTRERLY